ncbi:hypothetical protein ACG74X_15410 [Marivita sp. S0852]|uniref:hypothetical protein n=1 Tax=Marivita sp. S0852 TaxID=3373893 RepID=UPI0039822EB0
MGMRKTLLAALAIVGLGATGWTLAQKPKALSPEELAEAYATPLPPPEGPLTVFHLGHSLVGRDMPAMLAQLANHTYASQLGWGTPLQAHWEPDVEIQGFAVENNHDHYQGAKTALASGAYDAFVLTEMVEIEAAIDYFSSPEYLEKWAAAARQARPDIRVYLYETWHDLNDPQGWLNRLDTDPARYWEGVLLAQAMANDAGNPPIYVIPAGRVMANLVRRVDASGGINGMTSRNDLFARLDDGSLDPIHLNDLGAYLVALTHYAVLYHRSPVGLPKQLKRADGRQATAPSDELALLMQTTVWDVVTSLPVTGLARQ